MKILVICQYYTPEPFRHSDFCEELVRRGHEVKVVTGIPNYPMGKIYDGYRNGKQRDEIINGVEVHRCFTIERKHGTIHRFLNYYSYMFSSCRYVNKLVEDFDVVFVNQLSPVMMAKAGTKYKKKHHKKLALYCLDLWPESLIAGGVDRGSWVYRYFRGVSERIYRQADRIMVSSQLFSDYFENEFHITNTEYLPQYAEELFVPEQCRKEPDQYVDLMFAGNLGTAQSVSTIIEAARLLQGEDHLRWHIVGDGSEYDNLKKQAAGLPNVIFHGRRPLTEMPKYYSMADAMIVSMQKDSMLSRTLPGKVQTYMAVGKPILGSVDGETAKTIHAARCGFCGEAENPAVFADVVTQYLNDNNKEKLGINSRRYYEEHFDRDTFIDKLEEILEKCAAASAESYSG